MTCQQARQQLAAYRRDDWTAVEMRALADHLAGCAGCRQAEAVYRRVGESLRLLPTLTPDAAFRKRVFAAIEADKARLGPAAMRASRAETEPSLPVVRLPVAGITPMRRPQRPAARASLAVAAVLALALVAAQFIHGVDMGGAAANFFHGVSGLLP
ncbi:MAG: anti-sigma factor family protein [Ktedonobacterales bacterium]